MKSIHSTVELKEFSRTFLDAPGSIVGLIGELGAGKTTFVRSFIESLAEKYHCPVPKVTSPTFVFHQIYKVGVEVHHFDLYRFENATEQELTEIGYFEAVEKTKANSGFLFVEWPEKALTRDTLQLDKTLTIEIISINGRSIVIAPLDAMRRTND